MKRKDRNIYSKSLSVAVVGVSGVTVEIECQQSLQLPGFSIVGMSASSARETKERVLGAIQASGIRLPSRRIVINLSPACAWKEEGRGFDLPIAIACLAAADLIEREALEGSAFLGELTLAGDLRPSRAATALPRLLRERKISAAYVALESAAFAFGSLPERGGGFACLADVVRALRERKSGAFPGLGAAIRDASYALATPLELIRGHERAKLLLEVAAAGEHHVLFAGPRGVGKSLLASALLGVLPALDREVGEEIDAVHALAGIPWDGARPFRSPHSSITPAAMLGGGLSCVPGELSLAHGGVIFLDELLEFRRDVLEALRVTLESGEVRVSRADTRSVLPARAQFISATNLCPCGVAGDTRAECRCDESDVRRYRRRLSHAMRDRIDLALGFATDAEGAVVTDAEARAFAKDMRTAAVRARCEEARERMRKRQGKPNGRLCGVEIFSIPGWTKAAQAAVETRASENALSRRALVSIARVARTIADLAGRAEVREADVEEAMRYKRDPLPPTSVPALPRTEWLPPFSVAAK